MMYSLSSAGCVTDFETEMLEYIRRDLLNLALGNRDNHGRNMAVLKDVDGTMRLAPLYDFGPAFLDARSIVRVFHWDGEDPGQADLTHIPETWQPGSKRRKFLLKTGPAWWFLCGHSPWYWMVCPH